MRLILIWLLGCTACAGAGPRGTQGALRRRSEPQAVALEPARASAMSRRVADPACRVEVQKMLVAGRRGDRCDRALEQVSGEASRTRFGVVEYRKVDLVRLRERLAVAQNCRTWPLRDDDNVVRIPDARGAGCSLRRFQGEVTIDAIDALGTRHVDVFAVAANDNGEVELRFAAIDKALRVRGLGGLAGHVRLELGGGAWAGIVDLVRLREFLAGWHWTWIQRGRGSPVLYGALHPDVAWASDVAALTRADRMARRKRDYEDVRAGEMSPRQFLLRYPDSPFREDVMTLERGGTPARP